MDGFSGSQGGSDALQGWWKFCKLGARDVGLSCPLGTRPGRGSQHGIYPRLFYQCDNDIQSLAQYTHFHIPLLTVSARCHLGGHGRDAECKEEARSMCSSRKEVQSLGVGAESMIAIGRKRRTETQRPALELRTLGPRPCRNGSGDSCGWRHACELTSCSSEQICYNSFPCTR